MSSVVVNYNPALQTSYKLIIPGLDSFNYFSTSVDIPGLNSGGIDSPYKDNQARMPSDRIDYDPLNVDFIIAEDFGNHTQMRMWLYEFHRGSDPMWTTTKNLQLMIMNSNMVARLRVEFYNAFPTALGSIHFDSSVSDNDALHCTATFSYQYYDVFPVI